LAIAGMTLAAAGGCTQEMANQHRLEPLERSTFFGDGAGSRQQVPGTIATDQPWPGTPERSGRANGAPVPKIPVPITEALLARGRERYGIYCANCHGQSGYGDGMVVARGFPQPPSYHQDRLRAVPDGHIFLVVKDGLGRMPALGRRIEPEDRWAIVAYVRALQLSQHATTAELSPEDMQQLARPAAATPAAHP
jgi:mono/diheme cytochrome c family protein